MTATQSAQYRAPRHPETKSRTGKTCALCLEEDSFLDTLYWKDGKEYVALLRCCNRCIATLAMGIRERRITHE